MFEKLEPAARRYEDMEYRLSLSETARDPAAYTALVKEYNRLSPIIEAFRAFRALEAEKAEADEIQQTSDDPAMRDLAFEESIALKEKLETAAAELKQLLIPRDPDDDRSVIMEIRAGTGGEEATLFASDLFRMYTMYAEANGFRITVTSANETELGGYREITFLCEGKGAFARFKFESGVHRVQRVPVTESQGRIQTSAATVAVLPEVEAVEVEIKDSDLIFEACKSSGAGGQHINKTSSAVRLTHKPTGIVVECQEERSQFQNKDRALEMLRAKLYQIQKTAQDEEIASSRRSQVGAGDRSEKIRTYNFPQNRITDHRIGFSLYDLDNYMDGNLAPMIEALTAAETAEKLKDQDDF